MVKMQRVMSSEEEQFLLYKQSGKKSQVLPDSVKEGVSPPSPCEFRLDERFLIDPQLICVGSKIGEGAHGKVYKGMYQGESVAVKILQRGETPEEKARLETRFAREVAMMSRVQHKNLVKFIGACKDPIKAIVTELLPGMSLRKYMISLRPNRIDLHLAISFALDIAQAMDCLHASGIIHRDLKPGNMNRFTSNQLLLENVRLYSVQSLLRCTPFALYTSCLKRLVIVVWTLVAKKLECFWFFCFRE